MGAGLDPAQGVTLGGGGARPGSNQEWFGLEGRVRPPPNEVALCWEDLAMAIWDRLQAWWEPIRSKVRIQSRANQKLGWDLIGNLSGVSWAGI